MFQEKMSKQLENDRGSTDTRYLAVHEQFVVSLFQDDGEARILFASMRCGCRVERTDGKEKRSTICLNLKCNLIDTELR